MVSNAHFSLDSGFDPMSSLGALADAIAEWRDEPLTVQELSDLAVDRDARIAEMDVDAVPIAATYGIGSESCLVLRVVPDPELSEDGDTVDTDLTGPYTVESLRDLREKARKTDDGSRGSRLAAEARAIAYALYGVEL